MEQNDENEGGLAARLRELVAESERAGRHWRGRGVVLTSDLLATIETSAAAGPSGSYVAVPPTLAAAEPPAELDGHELDTTVRPAACSCGRAKFAGSPTFVRRRHAAHVEEAILPPGVDQ